MDEFQKKFEKVNERIKDLNEDVNYHQETAEMTKEEIKNREAFEKFHFTIYTILIYNVLYGIMFLLI